MTLDEVVPKSDVPPGKVGGAEVQRFEVTREEAAHHNFMTLMSPGAYGLNREVPPGAYSRLVVDGVLWMSDTPAERRDHVQFVRAARGHCLVTGLGLGVGIAAAARKPEVERVTVIERDPDVIALVAPHMPEGVEVVRADALEWRPPKSETYGAVWHDIWPDICADNLPEMGKLCRRFARRADWQGCWCHAAVKSLRRSEREYRW